MPVYIRDAEAEALPRLDSSSTQTLTRTGAISGRPVIACPVCSQVARTERFGNQLRVVCGSCCAVYQVAGSS